MAEQFYPNEMAADYIESLGVDPDKVYNNDGDIRASQLSLLLKAPFQGEEMAANAYKTIKRFNDSTFAKAEENSQADVNAHYNWSANIEATMVGTVSTALMEDITKQDPNRMIKWLPSTADEQDVTHATFYGKTMTMQTALDRGLGTRPGCKCGFENLDDNDTVENPLSE